MSGELFKTNEQIYNGHWIGEVTDDQDPDQAGRIQVYIFGMFDDVPESDYPWVRPIMSPFSGSDNVDTGSFSTPTIGSHVMCIIPNNNPNLIYCLGVIPGMKNDRETPQWNARSRGKQEDGPAKIINDNREAQRVDDDGVNIKWKEPNDTFKSSEYPKRSSILTDNGIAVEIDDTKGNETVMVYHPKGSYVEIQPDGSMILHSESDNYKIVKKNDYTTVKGDKCEHVVGNRDRKIDGNRDTSISGNETVEIKGNRDITTSGNNTEVVKGDEKIDISGNRVDNISGNQDQKVGGSLSVDVGGSINLSSGGSATISSPTVTIGKGATFGVVTQMVSCQYTGSPHGASGTVKASM